MSDFSRLLEIALEGNPKKVQEMMFPVPEPAPEEAKPTPTPPVTDHRETNGRRK